jgi:glycosyltransferase involved in cell wall biosynthesis
MVNTIFPPDQVGGAEISVYLLAKALVEAGHEVTVLCLCDGREPKADIRDGVRVRRVPIDNIYWPFHGSKRNAALMRIGWHLIDMWNMRAARRFAEILEEEDPDVVHTNNITGFSVALWSEARKRNIRIAHTLRDYSLLCKRATLFKKSQTCERRCASCLLFTLTNKWVSHQVDVVASNSRYVLDAHFKFGYFREKENAVIYNIADFGALSISSRPVGEDVAFGYIGRIEDEKGIKVLLEASQALPSFGWTLKIAGRGDPVYVAELKARFPDPRIQWLGFVKPGEFYSSIDVTVISSIWPEPLPRTLIESIAAGRATICSTAGGIPEIAELSRLVGVYAPTDASALAALMSKAMANRHEIRRDIEEEKMSLRQFSADSIVCEYVKLYTGTFN